LVIRNGGVGEGHRFVLVPGSAVNLLDGARTRPLGAFRGQQVAAVAGIGNPGRFFELLRSQGILVEERPYPDHHPFSAEDVEAWPPGPVLMTEKDAVKCAKFAASELWYCPVRAEPDDAFVTALFARLDSFPKPKV
jgi:tetraacyldisaccharide 4'-kinase